MPRDARAYLHDMSEACAAIQDLIEGITLGEYLESKALRWAVERQFTIVGEAMYQMQRAFPEVARRIPEANRIVRFRHVLVHGYAVVQDEVVWGVAQGKLSELQAVLKHCLEDDEL